MPNLYFFKGMTKEQIEDVDKGQIMYSDIGSGRKFNVDNAKRFYDAMAKIVVHERKRLGGDFAIAQAIPTRELRDFVRNICGPDLIFVILVLPKQTALDRLQKRHGDEKLSDARTDMCVKLIDAYESKGENEENSFDIVIDGDMTPDDVAEKIMDIVNKV